MAGERLKLFISYSRRDMAVADALVTALEGEGFEIAIDRRDLPYGEEWQKELADFIRDSDTVVWLVSPDSVTSKWCNWELGEVGRLNKRLVPVKIRDVAELPESLGKVHLLPAVGVYDSAIHLSSLVTALNTDRAWTKEATRLADRAREWSAAQRNPSLLLRGTGLKDAEAWSTIHPKTSPPPASEVLELILASRRAAVRRQRWAIGSSLAVAAVLAIVAGWAWLQRQDAILQRNQAFEAESGMLANVSQQEADKFDYAKSLETALRALPAPPTFSNRPFSAAALRALNRAIFNIRERSIYSLPSQRSEFALSSDGLKLSILSEDGSKVLFIDLSNGHALATVALSRQGAYELQFAGDDDTVMVIGSDYKLSFVNRLNKGQHFISEEAYSSVLGVSPHHDLAFVCTADTNEAVAVDLVAKVELKGPRDRCGRVVFPGPGRARFLSSGRTFARGPNNELGELKRLAPLPSYAVDSPYTIVSPNHRYVVLSANQQLGILDPETDNVLWSSRRTARPIALTDNLLVLEDDGKIEIIAWKKNKTTEVPLGGEWRFNNLSPAAFSPDQETLYVGSENGRIGVWKIDVKDSDIFINNSSTDTLCCHAGPIEELIPVSASALVSLDGNQLLKVWNRPSWIRSAGGIEPSSIASMERLGVLVLNFMVPEGPGSTNVAVRDNPILGRCRDGIPNGSAVQVSSLAGRVVYLENGKLKGCDRNSGQTDEVELSAVEPQGFALSPASNKAIVWSGSTASVKRQFYWVGPGDRIEKLETSGTDLLLSGAVSSKEDSLVLVMARRAVQAFVDQFIRIIDLKSGEVTAELDDVKGATNTNLLVIDQSNTAYIGDQDGWIYETIAIPSDFKESIVWAQKLKPMTYRPTLNATEATSFHTSPSVADSGLDRLSEIIERASRRDKEMDLLRFFQDDLVRAFNKGMSSPQGGPDFPWWFPRPSYKTYELRKIVRSDTDASIIIYRDQGKGKEDHTIEYVLRRDRGVWKIFDVKELHVRGWPEETQSLRQMLSLK